MHFVLGKQFRMFFLFFLDISPCLSPFHTTSLARLKTRSDSGTI